MGKYFEINADESVDKDVVAFIKHVLDDDEIQEIILDRLSKEATRIANESIYGLPRTRKRIDLNE